MKKITFVLFMLLMFTSLNIFSQIVSTSPQNKKVVLEEFTGVRCQFCPDGHAIAQAIKNAHPDDVFLVNIHQGGYANPQAGWADFTTPFGNAIAGQTGLVGYPAGTVNRHFYPGTSQGANGTTAQSRNNWTNTANQTLTQSSYVNIAATSEIDTQTRELSVYVEVYYTGDSPLATNNLNIALLQDNTIAGQVGGGTANYQHNHRLVHFLTGQWGEEITTTTQGTLYTHTFTYTIPADYHGYEAELAYMNVVAYVAENHQEIMTGTESFPALTNIPFSNEISIENVSDIIDNCSGSVTPQLKIKNNGSSTLTNLAIDYSVNAGSTQTYNWSGSITPLKNETIAIDAISFTLVDTNNTLNITLASDEDTSNNNGTTSFDRAVESTSANVFLQINTDNWGGECHWNITDSSGAVVAQSTGTYGNNITINETLNLGNDCFQFNLIDDYGDGGNTVSLKDADDNVLFAASGNYGTGDEKQFNTENAPPLSVENEILETVNIYPNPAKGQFTITNATGFDLSVYSILGKRVLTQNNISANQSIDTSNLAEGTYFVRISTENASKTKKLVIIK